MSGESFLDVLGEEERRWKRSEALGSWELARIRDFKDLGHKPSELELQAEEERIEAGRAKRIGNQYSFPLSRSCK